jgi:murein tripeptide amidase MpaA
MIQVVEDGAVTFSQRYNNAVDAVHAYDRFTDFGFAKLQREIVLVEPSGKAHAKVFDGPLSTALKVK